MRNLRGTYVHRGDAARRRRRIKQALFAAGSIAVTTVIIASRKTTTANALKNPYAAGAGDSAKAAPPGPEVAVIARDVDAAGDTLFQTYCAVCHGIAGDAKGPVSSRIGAPSLLTGRARAYSDGYIYSIIRYGRGVMPRYGDKVYLPSDRWAIVNHVRKLQGQTPLAPEPANAAVGIPPAPSATGSTGERPR